jgi:hypothetical protein
MVGYGHGASRLRIRGVGKNRLSDGLILVVVLTVAVAGCQSVPLVTPALPTPIARQDDASPAIALARAAGERLRYERKQGFSIFPTFLRVDDHELVRPMIGNEDILLESLRGGARAQYADTLAMKDSVRVLQLPDSARYYYTLLTQAASTFLRQELARGTNLSP